MPANTGKVAIEATYKDKTKRDMSVTSRAVAGLKRQVLALGAAWGAREVARFTLEVSKLATTSRITTETFQKLAAAAGTDAATQMEKLSAAVGGTMSDLVLMQKVGAAVDAGLTFDQARTALEFLRRYSVAFGKDFNQLTQTIFTGLQRGSVLFLDDAGIILSAEDQMFQGLGSLEKKSALVGEAIRLMTEKMKTLPEITRNAVTETDRLGVSWENFKLQIGRLTEGPVTAGLSLAADAAQRMADDLERSAEAQRRLLAFAAAAERARAKDSPFRQFTSGDSALRAELTAMSAEEAEIKRIDDARRKRLEDENAAIARVIAASQSREKALKKESDALEVAGIREQGRIALMEAATAAEADLVQEVAEADLNAYLDAEAKKREAHLNFLDALEMAEVKASQDVGAIRKAEVREWYLFQLARARAAQATEEEITRLRAVYAQERANIDRDSDAERDRKAEDRKNAEIRHILLYFDADASNVKNASDLAAYSIGLLTEKLRGLDPAIASAIDGIQSIVVGAKAGGAAGAAGIIGGAVGIVSGVFGALDRRAKAAAAETKRLNAALADASSRTGELARALEDESILGLQGAFRTTVVQLRQALGDSGTIYANLNDYTVDVTKTLQTVENKLSGNSATAARTLVYELKRIEEAIDRFGGAAYNFGDAMDNFNHAVRMEGSDNPARQLELLSDALIQVGIDISRDLERQYAFNALTLKEQRGLLEQINDLNRQIADAELDARQDQADLVIQSIYDQADAVEKAIEDAASAQKQAALRSVSLQYDIMEMALRRSFTGALTGAGDDPFEIARVLGEAQNEIALLQLAEEADAAAALDRIQAAVESANAANDETTTLLVQAVENAAANSDMVFETALATELQSLGGDFSASILAMTGDLAGATNLTRFAMLGAKEGIDVVVGNTASMATSIPNIVVAIDAMTADVVSSITALKASGAAGSLEAIGNEYLATIAANTADLSFIRQNTYGAWYQAWMFRQDRSLGDLISAVNAPAWAANGIPGGSGGGTTVNVSVTNQIDNISTGGGADARSIWSDGLEDVVIDSLVNGELGRELGKLLRSVGISTTPNVPSNIRT